MTKTIIALIRYALILGMAGQLVDATIAMQRKAFEASQNGLISLRKLNQNLSGSKTK